MYRANSRQALAPSVGIASCWLVLLLMITACMRGEPVFTMEPRVVRECDLPVATRVSWDVRPLGLNYAQVYVNNFAKPEQSWVAGGATGSHESGKWAADGYTVTLKAMNGVMLARRTLTTTPCPEDNQGSAH